MLRFVSQLAAIWDPRGLKPSRESCLAEKRRGAAAYVSYSCESASMNGFTVISAPHKMCVDDAGGGAQCTTFSGKAAVRPFHL